MSSTRKPLSELREQLEQVDAELVGLLRRRMALAEEVMKAKLAMASPIRDDAQGERVLERVRARATEEGLNPFEVERLFRWIMEMSIARQQAFARTSEAQPVRVAFVAIDTASPHVDAPLSQYAGKPGGVHVERFVSVREAISALRRMEVHFALVPIETTFAGGVNETYLVLAEGGLSMTGEVEHDQGRYVELALEPVTVPGGVPCKTSLILELEHRPGALGGVVQAFASKGVNLTKLESRPVPGAPGRYRFYVDVDGHVAGGPLSSALELVGTHVQSLRVLGSYPRVQLAQAAGEGGTT